MKIKTIKIPIQNYFGIKAKEIKNCKLICVSNDNENVYYHYEYSPEKIIKYYVDITYSDFIGIYNNENILIYYAQFKEHSTDIHITQYRGLGMANEYMQANNLPLFPKPNEVTKRHYIYDYETTNND